MHCVFQIHLRVLLAAMLLIGAIRPAIAADQDTPLAGTISMQISSMALVVGAEWGKGILTLTDGEQYRFIVKGLEVGSTGTSTALLHGRVYHLTNIEDFAGLYGAVEADMSIVGGSGAVAMRNQHGVVVYLESIEEGVQLTLGAAGIEITLQQSKEDIHGH